MCFQSLANGEGATGLSLFTLGVEGGASGKGGFAGCEATGPVVDVVAGLGTSGAGAGVLFTDMSILHEIAESQCAMLINNKRDAIFFTYEVFSNWRHT